LKLLLFLAGIFFLIISWANPQRGIKKAKAEPEVADIYIALDVSNSMYAEDISPNRLDRTKLLGKNLITELKGERIGIIIFAGIAELLMPLTSDYFAAETFLESARPEKIDIQGTAIGEAIQLASASFDEEEEEDYNKVLILISDGENHEENAVKIAKAAFERENLIIFCVGVGTSAGGLIPINFRGSVYYKKDKDGNTVRTKLNDRILKEVAKAGGGAYFPLSEAESLYMTLKNTIENLEKRSIEKGVFDQFESYFQYFLAIAFLLLLIEYIISERKSKWLNSKQLFEN
jgi:Ca-activated chloride channel family protein